MGTELDRLATALRQASRPCVRLTDATCTTSGDAWQGRAAGTVVIAHGPHTTDGYRGDADIVVDLHDPAWPVIRHLDWWFVPDDAWYRTESQAFFAARATTATPNSGDAVVRGEKCDQSIRNREARVTEPQLA